MPHYTIEALKSDELGEAWPIVRAAGLHATIDWWIAEASELITGGGGVLVARAPDCRIHGVAAFALPSKPGSERVIAISTLITFDLSQSAPARAALLAAVERIATKMERTHVLLPLTAKSDAHHASKSFVACPD